MNILTGILARQNILDNMTIIWSPSNNNILENTLINSNHRLIPIENIYFGCNKPQIILCNNKISYFNICKTLSIQYHLPLVVIDHEPINSFINYEKIQTIDKDNNTIKVAINDNIFRSWYKVHDHIIDSHNTNEWNKLLNNIASRIYTL